MTDFWQKGILDPLGRFRDDVLSLLPDLLQSLVIVLIGLLVAWLLKEIIYRLLRLLTFDRLCARLGITTAVERVGAFRSPSYLAGQAVQWFIIVLALLTGLSALETEVSDKLLVQFLAYLPNLIVAGFILVLGAIASRFLGRAVLLAAVNAQMRAASLAAGTVRFLVMSLATVAALEHLGIGRTTVLVAFGAVFGGVVLALAMAFGLGGRDLARELLEGQLRKHMPKDQEDQIRHL